MFIQQLGKSFSKVFGSRNDRLIKRYRQRVEQINALEPGVRGLTDAQLRDRTATFRDRVAKGEAIRELLPEVMATAREAMDRYVGIRNALNPEFRDQFPKDKLPPDIRREYDHALEQVDALDPDPVKGGEPAPPHLQVELSPKFYEAVRELFPKSRPPFRARPFDVQLIGGMVLGEGRIAEMKTGEGKTIVAPLACYVACVDSLQCHVVTVNDYLVQRDRDWVFPFYYGLGLTVGAIHPQHMQNPFEKKEAYECDVLYGTNSELGFDYLRDNMKLRSDDQVQKRRDFCIVDEIDSILIDEARTPLIISGPAHEANPAYDLADNIARHLMQKQREWDAMNRKVEEMQMRAKGLQGDIRNAREKAKVPQMKAELRQLEEELPRLEEQRDEHTQYFEVEMEKKASHLTHDGVAEAQRVAEIGSFYVGDNIDFPHLLENALRAHAVYQKDKDYVVDDGEVVIVDEFTGRKMVGRQWSNGLHQAVEAKEGVKIKQETQTLATVTIQNFFKLYRRLAGMTGTAITEATEFHEIYKLDVVVIPTNLPVIRRDREDLIFLSQKDKWNAILDEIKRVHDLGRPVLVGTTSVDNSEKLSVMLNRRHGIRHNVLNAKQHEREADVVAEAGALGAVMIATNMAGRGTDIKLTPLNREELVKHWQNRNLLPKTATPDMSDEQLLAASYSHQAQQELGIKPAEARATNDDELKLRLFRHWVQRDAFVDEKKAQAMTLEACLAELDRVPDYGRHRMQVYPHIEQMGGLHIIGTERHESRRIDNQLRGRAGRQGDRGSSRFFIALEDDLMKMFAGGKTLTILSKLGMKEGDAIEHRMVSRSVERAQRKVEERNYEIRKNLLEYDEVMEHQRSAFYGIRQSVLEGEGVAELVFRYIEEAVDDATDLYLAKDYVQTQVAEWCRSQLDVSVEPARLHLDDLDDLQRTIRRAAADEASLSADLTLGEYMSNDMPPEEWDVRGLSQWAQSRFGLEVSANELRQSNVDEVRRMLIEASKSHVESQDLTGLAKFLEPRYGERELAAWCREKFGFELTPAELEDLKPEAAATLILQRAREAYRHREVAYPVEYHMDIAMQLAQQDGNLAGQAILEFANSRYDAQWTPESLVDKTGQQIAEELVNLAKAWLVDGRLEEAVDAAISQHGEDRQGLARWLRDRFGIEVVPDELSEGDDGSVTKPRPVAAPPRSDTPEKSAINGDGFSLRDDLIARGRESLRQELTQLERYVLLQILDQAWKDHLYAMDQLKDSIGLRGYAEKDPRIEYKREGSRHFQEMRSMIRDRVTQLIFRARLTPNVRVRSAYGEQQQAHHAAAPTANTAGNTGTAGNRQPRPEPAGVGPAAAASVAAQGTASQQADLAAAERAGSSGGGGGGGDGDDDDRRMTRKQRRAAKARSRKRGGKSR